jgi:8-oxo-dGTP pyrophosphatase MutT (NUDIX family)
VNTEGGKCSNREELIGALEWYSSAFEEELKFKDAFLELLRSDRCFHRDHLPGHITGSAFIIDESGAYALLTHHAKLNKWLQPGGHADGDDNVLRVALREAGEETGLTGFKLLHPRFFDIDIHTIPSRADFPEHQHYDVRFLLQTNRSNAFTVTKESHALAWVPFDELAKLTANDSIGRMLEKIRYSNLNIKNP